MITPKHPDKPKSNTKILILQIDSDDKIKPSNNIFKSHKLRKLCTIETSRKSKAINTFEKIDFKDLLIEKFPSESLPIAANSQRTHRSSYLAYKEEQRLNKVKHYNKISCLKNKIIQHPLTIDHSMHQRQSQTYQEPRSKRKMSTVVLGESLSQGNQEAVLSKSRNIYIKTSQGKRQKINPNAYMTKIKQKIQNLCDFQSTKKIAAFSTNYIQSTYNEAPIKMQPFLHERHNITRNIRARNFKKQQSLIKQDSVNECRPWTSRNSDPPQQ